MTREQIISALQNNLPGSQPWSAACTAGGGRITRGQDDFATPFCELPAAIFPGTYVAPGKFEAFTGAAIVGVATYINPIAGALARSVVASGGGAGAPGHPASVAREDWLLHRAQALAAARARLKRRRRYVR